MLPLSLERPKIRTPITSFFVGTWCLLHHDALSLLLLGQPDARNRGATAAICDAAALATPGAAVGDLLLEHFLVVGYHSENGLLENLLDALHFLATALHVLGAHSLRHGQALFGGDWCETLGFEHVDACFLVAQIRLEADEDEGCVGAEMEDFGVPLRLC